MNRSLTILITGCSTGIGRALAHEFSRRGNLVYATARNADAIADLQSHGIRTAALDVDDAGSIRAMVERLAHDGIDVDVLVNNAGYGVPGLYLNVPWAVQETMLQVMVVGVAELTRRLWPGMIERGYGRVINVASLAGLVPAPAGHTLYGATKAFLIKFSEALAQEGRPHGVHVTALCPGFTRSEFHDVTGTREQMNKLPSWFWLDADTVARIGFEAVEAGTTVCVTGRLNRAIALAVRYLPQWIVHATGRRLGRAYRKT